MEAAKSGSEGRTALSEVDPVAVGRLHGLVVTCVARGCSFNTLLNAEPVFVCFGLGGWIFLGAPDATRGTALGFGGCILTTYGFSEDGGLGKLTDPGALITKCESV